jgi:hypothetical protein
MDPVSMIAAAIAMGAAAGLKDTASQAVCDAYAGLKALIKRHYAHIDVTPVEAKPESTAKRASLAEDLASAGAGENPEILEGARALVEAVKASDPQAALNIGVDLDNVSAASVSIRGVKAGDVGVRARDSTITGALDIENVDSTANRSPLPKA